jgi:uncharacterized protein with PIN domain
MNIYYVVAVCKLDDSSARFAVSAESRASANEQVITDHCGDTYWKLEHCTYIGRKSDLDPEFFLELP